MDLTDPELNLEYTHYSTGWKQNTWYLLEAKLVLYPEKIC
jgi:hypothetical protein